jgi:hypothetical protein
VSKLLAEPHPLNQSCLYKLRGKGQFEAALRLNWDTAEHLIAQGIYRVWLNDTGRAIQAPEGLLKTVHQRIGDLLARIELPDYLFSQKGHSYADNARAHRGNVPLVKTDISKFYPSITHAMVVRLFRDDFQCAADIAHRLADLCCYQQQHLPTGSSLSGRVAFWAARAMFDEVATLSAQRGCVMTAYVDDITVSGQAASKTLLAEIRHTVHQHGLKTKSKKSLTYPASAAKLVTGVIVAGEETRLPNQRHQKIHQLRQTVAQTSGANRDGLEKQLQSRLQEARYVTRP